MKQLPYGKVKTLAIALIIICLFSALGCGASGANPSGAGASPDTSSATSFALDVSAAGKRLRDELEYRDSLEELDATVVYTLLGIDANDVIEQKNYFSSGATAEEIIVFKASGKDALGTLKAVIEARIEDQQNVYVSYAPQEVGYLKNAIIETKDNYLIYCVPVDPEAAAKLAQDIFAGR